MTDHSTQSSSNETQATSSTSTNEVLNSNQQSNATSHNDQPAIEVSSTGQQVDQSQNVSTSIAVPNTATIISNQTSGVQALATQSTISSPSQSSAQITTSQTSQQSPQVIAVSQHTNSNPILAPASSLPQTGQTVHIHAPQHQQTPILHTSVHQSQPNNVMSNAHISVSQLPQVQVIQQQLGATPAGTYQFQQVYPQQMLLPSNLTIQNMPFGTANAGLQLQIPFSTSNVVGGPLSMSTSIAGKPPIMSKGVAISPLAPNLGQNQSHMISPLKQNIAGAQQILKPAMMPGQQFVSTQNQILLSNHQFPMMQQQSHQTILPATNRSIADASKGKSFMFSHAGTIQPKSPILPASPAISSSQIITNPHFKTHLTNANTALIAQTPGLITNQQPILGSFSPQILTGNWVTATPQSTLVAQNSPIFIRTPGQHGEHMFIQTSSTPQIQTVSMATQINQIAPTPTSVQVAPSQVTLTNTSHQQVQNSCNTNSVVNVSSAVTSVQQSQVASTPSNRPRPLRPANSISSVATQTIPGPNQQKQSDSSSTTQKTIQSTGTSKTKLNQSTAKSSSSVQTSTKSTGATQTTQTSANQQQQTNSNKSDASNQTHKVSVGTETMSSTKMINKSMNETTTKSASKSQSTEAIRKNTPEVIRKNTPEVIRKNTPEAMTKNKPEESVKPVKRTVEKKDASTEQDKEMLDNYYAQKLQQQKQNAVSSMQLNNVNSHQNGQILTEANRHHEVTTKQPQKAIVKPQILTHVIDGYVIQESPDPFPVNGLSFSFEKEKEDSHMKNDIVNNQKGHSKNKNENVIAKTPKSRNDYSICENCGKRKPKNKMKGKNKRFCANCSNQFKEKEKDKNMMKVNNLLFTNSYSPNDTSSTDMEIDIPEIPIDNANKQNEDKKRKATKRTIDSRNDNNQVKNQVPVNVPLPNININENGESMNAIANRSDNLIHLQAAATRPNDERNSISSIVVAGRTPYDWNAQEVYEFIRNIQDCAEYAEVFLDQDIDGQAMMLIKEAHLIDQMKIKLGPALKICSKINALREEVQKQN